MMINNGEPAPGTPTGTGQSGLIRLRMTDKRVRTGKMRSILKWFVRCTLLCLTLLCVSGYALQPVSAGVEFEKRVYRIYKGQTKQLVLKSEDGSDPEEGSEDGAPEKRLVGGPVAGEREIVWESSDPDILSVDENGVITGNKRGKATVTASDGEDSASMTITVVWYTVHIAVPIADPEFRVHHLEAMLESNPACRMEYIRSMDDFDVARFDGLVLPGGGDMDPAWYGQENTNSFGINEAEDELQMAVLQEFTDAGKPVLGLCRGCQLLNVFYGGTLKQHIGYMHYNTVYRDIKVSKDSFFSYYRNHPLVRQSHHQAVDEIGEGLEVTMRDASDGMIEGIEHVSGNVFGLQWHPELMGDEGKPVFKKFVRLCREQALAERSAA